MNAASRLRVLFAVVQSPPSPGPRYRVLQYLPFLESRGVEGTVVAMQGPRSTARSIRSASLSRWGRLLHYVRLWISSQRVQWLLVRRARQFDRVYLYKIPVSAWARLLLRRHRDRILVDFDDALDEPELRGQALVDAVRRRVLRQGLYNATSVSAVTVASNQRNAAVIAERGTRVVVIPTSVDLERVKARDRANTLGAIPVLGWIGTPSTAAYLVEIEGALRRIAATRPVVIRLVGAGQNPMRTVPVELVDWSLASEADDVYGFDIGLMPMPDTPWTRGKAAAKALQYGASGAPTVASWTTTNVEILGESLGALLARTEDEWVRAIETLLADPPLRSAMGRHARARVEEHYSTAANAPRLLALIRNPGSTSRVAG